MRALIRADLQPSDHFSFLWNERDEYDSQVIQMFLDMGYAPVKIGQEALLNHPFVNEILEDMPPDIKEQETEHLILIGYVGEGQSHFIVTGVNPTEIHIRIKGRLFGRLRRACTDLIKNARKLRDKRQIRILGGRLRIAKSKTSEKDSISSAPYIEIRRTVEVMEPKRDHPTMLGEIIDSASAEGLRQSKYDIVIILFTLLGSIGLFFSSPYLAPVLHDFLSWLGISGYDTKYIQEALERTYSAFLVSFFIAGLGVLTRIFDLHQSKPIKWDMDLESKRD
jgi:hypothetical protein